MIKENVSNVEDIFEMLDSIIKEQSRFNWDSFYGDREKDVPFFINAPDENLIEYFEKKWIKPGRVLELGCGPGRNAIYFAEQGCSVDAVDLSVEAIQWGRERAKEKKIDVNFVCDNIFNLDLQEGAYDIIYDSGCFHHIAPHRRISYLNLINKALKPGGSFAITCFVLNGKFGGADISDWDVYRLRSLKGGLGFTEDKLRSIFHEYEVIEIRKMREVESNSVFGTDALLASLFIKI